MHFLHSLLLALLGSFSISSTFGATESASARELASCLTLLCMDTGGCTAEGPKPSFNSKYFNIEQKTFAKCTFETEGELAVADKERVRRMSWRELEEAIEKCERNFSCGSACIYNYYFTVWERCPRVDRRTGREFSECEKMAFAYFDQNGWCDEKEHIWEKVRRELPAVESAVAGEGANGERTEDREENERGMGERLSKTGSLAPPERESAPRRGHVPMPTQNEEEDSSGELLQSQTRGGATSERIGQGQKLVPVRNAEGFDLVDHFDELESMANDLDLAFEGRRAEHSFVLGEKNEQGQLAERGARLVLTDTGEELEVRKVAEKGKKKGSRNILPKLDWHGTRDTIRGICIGLFQN